MLFVGFEAWKQTNREQLLSATPNKVAGLCTKLVYVYFCACNSGSCRVSESPNYCLKKKTHFKVVFINLVLVFF